MAAADARRIRRIAWSASPLDIAMAVGAYLLVYLAAALTLVAIFLVSWLASMALARQIDAMAAGPGNRLCKARMRPERVSPAPSLLSSSWSPTSCSSWPEA